MAIYVYTDRWDSYPSHIPNHTEFLNLKSIMDWLNLSWTDYRTKLHIPYTWSLNELDWTLTWEWDDAGFWSSAYDDPSDDYSWYVSITDANVEFNDYTHRSFWYSVRLFLDDYITPDNTRTVEAWTLWSDWIFYNADLWVISVTNGSDKNITMYDKNVGATTVYNNWDALSESNCWKFFQRWNYYWFPYSWATTTSSTKVDTTWYWGSNPYSSSTFIAWFWDRSDPQNNNLWTDSKEEYFVIE